MNAISPDGLDAATQRIFETNKKYFQTPLQLFQYYDKYARWLPGERRRETWLETVERVMQFLRKNTGAAFSDHEWQQMRNAMTTLDVMPSMRVVQMAGPALERDNVGVYNCFGRETRFVTEHGVKSFQDFEDGDRIKVLAHTGQWRLATVRCYGEQLLYNIRLNRMRTECTVRATADHRWILKDGTITTSLKPGDGLAKPPVALSTWTYEEASPSERLAWAYGYVYGDGTCAKGKDGTYQTSMVRLCKGDNLYLERFVELGFTYSKPLTYSGDAVVYTGSYLKDLPALVPSVELTAFIRGYLDADGEKDTNTGLFRSIQATGTESLEFIRSAFPMVGVYITREDAAATATNFGTRNGPTVRFGLTCIYGNSENSHFYCQEVTPDVRESVWCLEVEEDHSFVMPCGVVTGNCAYVALDDLTAFAELLYILMQGTGNSFSVEDRFTAKLPRIKKQQNIKPAKMVVEDSTEGWCNALKTGMETWFAGKDIKFDYSLIRPAGAPLNTKGGQAAGPQPLKDLLDFTRKTILNRQGKRLTSLDCHDIACYIGYIVQVGGVRRAAELSLSDLDDTEVAECKTGRFWETAPYRAMANNSAVFEEKPSVIEFMDEWLRLAKSGTGERGIFNRSCSIPERRKPAEFGINPCGEIVLRNKEFCNLSICVAKADDTLDTLVQKVRIATMFGTAQSMLTYFPYLSPEWKANCDEERLLGVDITGQRDCKLLREHTEMALRTLRQVAIDVNKQLAHRFGINQSVSITCVKPSGNSSTLLGCASGLHPRYAPFYIRRVRTGSYTPVAKLLKDSGLPCYPEVGMDPKTASVLVFEFPVKSPDGAVCRNDVTAIEQFEYWLANRRWYTEHSASCTVYVDNDEWLELGSLVYKNWEYISGLSFLPKADDSHVYALAPYEEISQEEYERRAAAFPDIDWSRLIQYEQEDNTTTALDFACVSGVCEL